MKDKSILLNDAIVASIVLIFFTSSYLLFSQVKENSSNDLTDKKIPKDTTEFLLPVNALGHKSIISNYGFPFTKYKLAQKDILFLEEVFQNNTGIQILNLSALGIPKPILANGTVGFAKSQWNGINAIEPHYGQSTFDFFPILMFDRIELFEGLEAFVFNGSSTGVAFNYVSRNFDSKVPYTQIWIGQGGYDFLGSGAVVSQNLTRNLNAHFSYERYWSAGRYNNNQSDRWNLLTGTRINISPKLNVKIEHRYTNWGYGLNGGVNPRQSNDIFENTTAIVNFQQYKRRIYQNDFNLSYLWELLADSVLSLSGNFLFSHSILEEEKDSTEFPNLERSFAKIQNYSSLFGTEQRIVYKNDFFGLTTGVEAWQREKAKIDSSFIVDFGKVFFYGLVDFSLTKNLNLVTGCRIGLFESTQRISFGSKVIYRKDTSYLGFFEGNYLQNMEVYNLKGKFNSQNNILFRVGMQFIVKSCEFQIKAFYRNFIDYSVFEPVYDKTDRPISFRLLENINYKAFGIDATVKFPLWFGLMSETRIIGYYSDYYKINNDFFPNFVFNQALKYRYTRGKSIAEIGISFELISPFVGFTYLPQWNIFARNNYPVNWQNDGINLFASLKLGNAFVSLAFENLLSSNFFYFPTYPEYDRNLRITLIWSFND